MDLVRRYRVKGHRATMGTSIGIIYCVESYVLIVFPDCITPRPTPQPLHLSQCPAVGEFSMCREWRTGVPFGKNGCSAGHEIGELMEGKGLIKTLTSVEHSCESNELKNKSQ